MLVLLAASLTSCCRTCRRTRPVEVQGTKWGLMELNDKVIDRIQEGQPERFTLTLGEDGRIGGKGDCNTFFAGYSLNGENLRIQGVAATRMLCPDQALENQYFRTLESAVRFKVDGNFLILINEGGKIVASFEKISD